MACTIGLQFYRPCVFMCTTPYYTVYVYAVLCRLRVAVEEEHLLDFFGREYLDYRRRVSTRLPGVD